MILEKTESFPGNINNNQCMNPKTEDDIWGASLDYKRCPQKCGDMQLGETRVIPIFPSSKDHNPSALKSIGEKIVTAYEPSGLSEPKSE